LHALGLVRRDINLRNILMDGDDPRVGDFGSCQHEGQRLGLKARTFGLPDKEFKNPIR
jgi:serine/threonine protein kinase